MARRQYLGFWRVPPDLGRRLPDYVGLVWVLTRLRNIPDGNGRTVLEYEEAWWIRRFGFRARAGGRWRCPPLPHRLVAANPLLCHLTDRPDLLPRGRRPSRRASKVWPLSKVEMKIVSLLQRAPYYMMRRELQQRLWRLGAPFFNQVLDSMIAEGRITEGRITEHEGFIARENFDQFVQR